MTIYEKFQKLPIDHGAIGLMQRDTQVRHYCTPQNAEIIGWAGVDGIHYCTIPQFGEMIFAVSPMNIGDCVHPIARNFTDLLRMLLYCGDLAALEQCYAWDEEQFNAFLIDCPATGQQQAVLDEIRKEFRLEPMEDAFAYVKKLQSGFDLSQIPYTEDYYDPDMNAAAPVKPSEWKVTYDGGFWPRDGRPGEEIPIGKVFSWGEEIWHIPAAYACGEGMVLDFCVEVAPARVKAWIDKWDLLNEAQRRDTQAVQRQIEQENPLNIDFRPVLDVNGQKMREDRGCGICWIPASCVNGEERNRTENRAFLDHYGLDKSRCWAIQRTSFPWAAEHQPGVRSIALHLEREMTDIPGPCFPTPAVGESIVFTHPITGAVHTLTAQAYQPQEMDASRMPADMMEYPRHYTMLTYTLEPEIPARNYILQDSVPNDEPRFRKQAAACMGIIGGADGPTAILFTRRDLPKPHAACSALHFEPAQTVQWQLLFREKLLADMDVRLVEEST